MNTDLANLSIRRVAAGDGIQPIHSLDAVWLRDDAGAGITRAVSGTVSTHSEHIERLETNVEYAQSRICEQEKRIMDLECILYKLSDAFTKHCNGELESDIVAALWNVLDQ